ncbi:uncharacterized protein K452DRAFT_316404 [Aplosporella prunicola CBS 121167]|uniref:Cytochrome P450 n=1 Tax=Aplosporella prunicola CBS 121167 TaxID=1176127 RepID=A0A6A6BL51_9PEZI|nr:uncharacterized protein K452DRAFT_316404 [Aplosporella prunicola CBS 121167]KAF2144398.1 hypothetical protein K452DRAFT_316404 [Aplosporella prunicola CBS 121167]
MHLTAFLGLWAIAAYIIYFTLNAIVTRRRRATLAKKLSCKPPPSWNAGDLFGIKEVRAVLNADNTKRLPPYVMSRVEDISKREGRVVSTMAITQAADDLLFTCDPKNIQALLATQFKDFEFGPTRNGNFGPLLGSGIFAADGKQWEHSRAMLRPQFAREQISDLELEEAHVQNMLRTLPAGSDGWTAATDLQVLFFRLTLDSATEFLFGESVDSQLAALPGYVPKSTNTTSDERLFAYSFDKAQWWLARGARFGSKYWLVHGKDFKKQCREVHDYVDYFVQLALNKAARNDEEKASGRKEKYVFLDALAAQTRDPLELRAQLLNILLAGRDTTASLLGWLFLELSQNEAQFTKLRTGILEAFGPDGSDDPAHAINFAALKNCAPLQQALNETLRLYPVVPINSRRAFVDTTIPRGGGPDGLSPVFVRAGQEVNYSVYAMHRRRDLWGEDADEFRPERWEGRRPGWEYLPFNGGPRICIGQQFALTEAAYVVVRLMQKFDGIQGLDKGTKNPDLKYGLTLTSCPGEGVNVRLREAKRESA